MADAFVSRIELWDGCKWVGPKGADLSRFAARMFPNVWAAVEDLSLLGIRVSVVRAEWAEPDTQGARETMSL